MRRRRRAAPQQLGARIALRPAAKSATIALQPLSGRLRGWANDPASATRVGCYQAGGPMLTDATFASLMTFTRASGATDFGPDGAMVELAADTIRQGYDPLLLTPQDWLLEGQSTNGIRNPRAEGLVAGTIGSGGALPTNWQLVSAAGLACDIGPITANGMTGARLRFYGTSNSGSGVALDFEGGTTVVAAPSQLWSCTAWLREVAAPSPPTFYRLRFNGRTAAGAGVTGNASTSGALTLDGAVRPQTGTFTLTSDGTIARASSGLNIGTANGGSYDFTIDVFDPIQERSAGGSQTPILPTAGSPAAATRAADSLLIGGSAFSQRFGSGAAGFVIVDVMLPRDAPEFAANILQVEDGSDDNRLLLRNPPGGTIGLLRAIAGIPTGGPSLGSFTPGTPFRAGIRWGGGTLAGCLNGGTIQTQSVAGIPALSALRLGNSFVGDRALNGRLLGVWGGDFVPSDAKFIAACTLGADVDAVIRS